MDKKVLFFIAVVVVSFIVEIIMQTCSNRSIWSDIISFIHHILSIYGILGSILFGYHKEHLLFLVSVLIGWAVFGKCIFTIWYEKLCDIDSKNNRLSSHQDIVSRLVDAAFRVKLDKPIIVVAAVFMMLYDVYHIYK